MKLEFNAAVLIKQNEALRIIKLSHNSELQVGQILVKLISSGICGAQVNEISGMKGPDKFLPHMMGHEGYGEVIKIGPGVAKVKSGDLVVLHWRRGSGIDAAPAKFESEIGIVGAGPVTTFSEYSIVSENRVTRLETFIDPFAAALLGCGLTTAFGIVQNEIQIKKIKNALVIGAGGLGLNIIQALKHHGVPNIIAVDNQKFKEKLSLDIGANDFILCINGNLIELVKFKYAASFGADLVIDTTGNNLLIGQGFEVLGKSGKLVLVGQPKIGTKLELNNPLAFFDGKSIFASDGGLTNPDSDIPALANLINKNIIATEKIITHKISLCDINDGIDILKSGKSGRIVISHEQ